jgi:hypothetical protein
MRWYAFAEWHAAALQLDDDGALAVDDVAAGVAWL